MPDSLEDKLNSKKWDARAAGYEEIAAMFRSAQNANQDCFFEHGSQMKKYLQEANPGALEKALDALALFIDKADPKTVSTFMSDIIKNLIEKCIGHMKPSVRAKGLDSFNMLFEVTESFEESEETIIEGMKNK